MRTSESIAELQKALAEAQAQIGGATKDAQNPHFRSTYATLMSAWEAWQKVGPVKGLSVIQTIGRDEDGLAVTTRLGHASGEWLEETTPLLLGKNDMQGLGSATTYARRYALMALVGLAPEDDDGNAAVAAGPAPTHPKRAAPRQKEVDQEEPPHVKDAKAIIKHLRTIESLDELNAFMDEATPRLDAIKAASEATFNHVNSIAAEVDASLRIAA